MVNVICDTSFLIHLATKRIINFDNLEVEIGILNFIVPEVVLTELQNLLKNRTKQLEISRTLDYIKNFETLSILGTFADKELIDYILKNKGIVATLDKALKNEIISNGGSIITIHNNKIIFQN